jgi:hypothetical protein
MCQGAINQPPRIRHGKHSTRALIEKRPELKQAPVYFLYLPLYKGQFRSLPISIWGLFHRLIYRPTQKGRTSLMRDQFGTAYCGVGSKSSGDVIHICYMPMEKKHIPADKHYQEYGRNPHIVMSPTFAVNQQNSANCMPEMENRHHHPNCVPKMENSHHHPNCVPKMENRHHHPNCVPKMENSHHHPNCVPKMENSHHHPNCVPKMENSHHHPNCVPKVENCHHHPNCVSKMENCHHHPNCVPENECHHHHCANSVPEVEDCHKHTKDCRLDGCHCSVKCDCKCVEDVCTKYLRKELCKFIGKPIYIVIKR